VLPDEEGVGKSDQQQSVHQPKSLSLLRVVKLSRLSPGTIVSALQSQELGGGLSEHFVLLGSGDSLLQPEAGG